MPSEQRVREVFELVTAAPVAEWQELLATACEDDTLRSRVQALLDQYTHSADFLSRPAAELFAGSAGTPDETGETGEAGVGPTLGEFRIARELGRGGMGVVYLAQDTVLRRTVALKVLSAHVRAVVPGSALAGQLEGLAVQTRGGDEDRGGDEKGERVRKLSGRFEREAHAVARLRHPCIVQIFRYGQDRGFSFMAMEFVDGQTLRALIDADRKRHSPQRSRRRFRGKLAQPTSGPGPADIITAARRMADVTEAIDHAHKQDVIHRDIKPSNILIARDGKARVTDFGIAKIVSEDTLSAEGDIAGSFAYMSPEQARVIDAPIDQRSDVFSLGVVLYECLTYRRPFDVDGSPDVFAGLRLGQPRSPRTINPAVPRDLAVICLKALEKSPHDRYQSAAHLAADLRSYLEGRPILARPPTITRKLRLGIARHRFAVAIGAVVLMAAVTSGTYLQLRHLRLQSRAWLTVESVSRTYDASLQRQDDDTHELRPATLLGETPISESDQDLGVYRLTLKDRTSGRFAEVGLSLLKPGSSKLTRVVAGDQLALAEGDNRGVIYVRPAPADAVHANMVRIRAGSYPIGILGSVNVLTRPRTVDLAAFWIDSTEVSNREYKQFVDATSRLPPRHWKGGLAPDLLDRPVVCVTLEDARAYARWRGKRLPSSHEWEAAARGMEGKVYPWGNDLALGPPELEPTAADYELASSTTEADERLFYRLKTVNVDAPDAAPVRGGLLHCYDNVLEITDTDLISNNGVVIRGRTAARSPKSNPLSTVKVMPAGAFSGNTGFRCAISDLADVRPAR